MGPASVLLCAAALAVAGIASGSTQSQQTHTRTDHFVLAYPAEDDQAAQSFLEYAELVYADIDSLLDGALPDSLQVTLVSDGTSGSTDGAIHLSLHHGLELQAIFARELTRTAEREALGETYELLAYRFVTEGLAAWVEARYEARVGTVRPRDMWAAFAYMQEASYPEYLASYDIAALDLGRNVVDAAGYSFVSHLVDTHGLYGLHSLLRAMPANADICGALNDARLDCDSLVDGWQSALDQEAGRHDFSNVPELWSLLEVSGEGDQRDVALRVYIQNPESSDYLFFVSYIIDEKRYEEAFPADASEFRALVPLGQVKEGEKLLWEVAVWSHTIQTWRRSGWQDQIIR